MLDEIKTIPVSGKGQNKYDILIEFVTWISGRHYQDGLSKAMMIQKAQETLKKVENFNDK